MKMLYAGSATLDCLPEKVLINEEKIGIMFTYFDVYSKNGCTIKRIKLLKKRKALKLKETKNENK